VLRTFTEDSMMEHHIVSASGVFMPDDYEPAGARMIMPGPILDLQSNAAMAGGARAAFVSTIDSADVVVAPSGGGPVQRWTVTAGKTFVAADALVASGAAVAAM
jgi:hypothetical protein